MVGHLPLAVGQSLEFLQQKRNLKLYIPPDGPQFGMLVSLAHL